MTGAPGWAPPLDGSTNIERFMAVHGIADIGALRTRSVDDIDWFWDAAVRFLELPFVEPYQTVADTSRGIPWTTWFDGGTTNVSLACVDRWADDPASRDRVALSWEGEDGSTAQWTFGELRAHVDAFARDVAGRGLEPGDVVGVYMPMLPETVAVFFALAKLGLVVLPLFSGYGAEAIATRLDDAGACLVVTSATAQRRGAAHVMDSIVQVACARVPSVQEVMVIDQRGVGFADGDSDSTPFASLALPSETTLLLAYTSGTTGRPKGSVHVHGGFLAKIAAEVAFQFDVTPDDRVFWLADFGWIMGPLQFVGVLACGGSLCLYEGVPDWPDAGRMWELAERHEVTVLGTSPTLVRSLMQHGDDPVREHDLSRLRILGSTGEPWNLDPWNWYFSVVGGSRCPVINISGGTEVGACFLSPHPVEPIAPMSVGGPALGMAVDVFDEGGRSLRDGVGELVCTKPWPGMTRSLWNADDRYIDTYWSRWPDVWLHGDWASVVDGQWYLHGRSDDTINVAGKRLGPAEVESALVAHRSVVEAVAFGMPDPVKGQCLWVAVVLGEDQTPSEDLAGELRELVSAALGASFRPKSVTFVEALPKTRSAKVVRRTVRAVALGEDPGDTSSLEDPAALDHLRGAFDSRNGDG